MATGPMNTSNLIGSHLLDSILSSSADKPKRAQEWKEKALFGALVFDCLERSGCIEIRTVRLFKACDRVIS